MALGIIDLLDRIGASRAMMKFLTIYCGFGFLVVLASNVWSISTWTETRAVYDDICYLRQAHLFERFGLGGLDTNVTRDDDHYLSDKLREIGYPTWANAPCHTLMPASNKLVMQYPPGTGFAWGAAGAACSHRTDRSSDRPVRQFQAAESVPLGRLFHFLPGVIPH